MIKKYLINVLNRKDVLLAIPLYIIVITIVLLPMLYLLYGAFQTGSPSAPDAEFTFANIQRVFTSDRYLNVFKNTIVLAVVVTFISSFFGIFFSWLVARTDIPYRGTLEKLIPFPLFLSPFAAAVAWVVLGSRRAGFLNALYMYLFNAESGFMNIYTFAGLAFVMTLFFIPYAYLFTLPPMKNMDGALEEAASVGGASISRTMFTITFPVILPALTSAILMIFVLSAEMFSIPSIIGSPAGFTTLPYNIYLRTTVHPADWGGASALSMMLLIIMAVGITFQRWATKASARFVTISGKGMRPGIINLRFWRLPMFSIVFLYLILTVVLPFGALGLGSVLLYFTPNISLDLFTTNHWNAILGGTTFKIALRNSLTISFIGPTIAIALTFMLSFLWYKMRAPFKGFMETLASLPISFPGIVFGVGILWAFIRTPLYGTILLLIIAYVARYLPHPLRVFSSTIVQLDKGLEESARVAGAGMFKIMTSITAPILRHATLSGWILLFLIMMRELNVAIMIYTSESTVLPVMVWGEVEAGSLMRASVVALITMLITSAVFLISTVVLKVDLARDR